MRPNWTRLHPGLNKGQRAIAISAIIFGTLVSLACFILIFALADLGRPSLLPWIVWFLFGVGPIVSVLEEYGAESERMTREAETDEEGADTEDSTETEALVGRPAPPHLRLIRSPEFRNDQPYDQEADHAHHVRTTG